MFSRTPIPLAFIYLLAGIVFGFGLAMAGMTDPKVVSDFLDIVGDWNPSLAFVMAGAILVTSIGYKIILGKNKPLFAENFSLPNNHLIDKNLIIGAMIFGIGWGLYGFCPGPALASLFSMEVQTYVFVVSMITGMFIADKFSSSKA